MRANGAVVASSTATVAPRARLFADVKGQRVDGRGDGRAHFETRGAGLEAREIGACAVGGLARLRQLFGARALLQFAQVRFGLVQVGLGGARGRHLAVGLGFAHQAARHEIEQPVAFAHRVVAFARARDRGAPRRRGSWWRSGPFLSSVDARLGLGELRARGVDLGGGHRAILHDDDVAGLDASRLRQTAAR